MTMGIVLVASVAALIAGAATAKITSGFRTISSVARAGSRSYRLSAYRKSRTRFLPSIHPSSDRRSRNALNVSASGTA